MDFDLLAPVNTLIDKAEELIGHSPHTAVVSIPVGAWAVSNVCDGLALATGDDSYDDAARLSMAIGLVGAAGAAVTGLRDYSYIGRDKPSHDVATTHAIGNAIVGTLFGASFAMRARDHAAGRPTRTAARLLGLAAGSLALYTAWLGGVLVSEYGESVKPVMDAEKSDEEHGRRRLNPVSPLGVH